MLGYSDFCYARCPKLIKTALETHAPLECSDNLTSNKNVYQRIYQNSLSRIEYDKNTTPQLIGPLRSPAKYPFIIIPGEDF